MVSTEYAPYLSMMRLISDSMMSSASSQLMRTYLDLPRLAALIFAGSPPGSQSTRFKG